MEPPKKLRFPMSYVTKYAAQIVVWNAATKQIRNTVTGFHTVGICGLTWSPCGKFLASLGADEFHSLQIMEALSAQPIFRVR